MTKNDIKWENNFNVLKDYVEEFGHFPKQNTEYKGVKINDWLANQKTRNKKGLLEPNRLNSLNDFCPIWNGSENEKYEWAKSRLINSNWRENIPFGNTPIDSLYQDSDKLYICLSNKIYDCETLMKLDRVDHLNTIFNKLWFDEFECLSKIYPYIDAKRIRLLCVIYSIRADLEEAENMLIGLAVTSHDDLLNKFEIMLEDLTDREKQVLTLRFGLDGSKPKWLEEVGKIIGVTGERIRHIENLALRKLKHPARRKVLFETNTILDYKPNSKELSKTTRGNLYRLGITTEEKLLEYIKGDISDNLRKEISEFLYELKNPKEIKQEGSVSLDDIEISIRSYNCLRRAGFNTLEEISKLSLNDLMKIRNLGRQNFIEILSILKDYDYEISEDANAYLEDCKNH